MFLSFIKRRRATKAARIAQEELNAAAIREGREQGNRMVNAVDDMMQRLVHPWSANMLDIFTKRVAMEVIFGDDPAPIARTELDEFYAKIDEHLDFITRDVRVKLAAWEQQASDWQMPDSYERLIKSRFGEVKLNLTVDAMNIAADVVIARNLELGVEAAPEAAEPLANGQRILKEVRATKIPMWR
jgi:hypothetical protein